MSIFGSPNIEKLKRKKKTDKLIKALSNKNHIIQIEAAKALGELGDKKAVYPLLKLKNSYRSPNRRVDLSIRAAVLCAISEIGDSSAYGCLIRSMKNETAYLPILAARCLEKMGACEALPDIIDLKFGTVSLEKKKKIGEVIYKLGYKCPAKLNEMLGHKDNIIRNYSAKLLTKNGHILKEEKNLVQYYIAMKQAEKCVSLGSISVPYLIMELKNQDRLSRSTAARALAEIADPNCVDELIQFISKLDHKNLFFGSNATTVLGSIGDTRATDVLISFFQKASFKEGKEAASIALAKFGTEKSLQPLFDVILNDNDQYRAATHALKERPNTLAIEGLKAPAYNGNPGAIVALSEIGSKQAVDSLLKIDEASIRNLHELAHQNKHIAIEALSKIKNAPAGDALLEILNCEDINVSFRNGAARSLGERDEKRFAESVLRFLCSQPFSVTKTKYGDYSKLFGIFTELIIDSISYIETTHVTSPGVIGKSYRHNLRPAIRAVKSLCQIKSPLVNNILYEISKKIDEKVLVRWYPKEGNYFESLSFKPIRDIAEKELEIRGNPQYEPNIYLDQSLWQTLN